MEGGTCSVPLISAWLGFLSRASLSPLMRSVWSPFAHVDGEEAWEATFSAIADVYHLCTAELGGRLWMVDAAFEANLSSFMPMQRPSCSASVCVPSGCSEWWVRKVVFPMFWFLTVLYGTHQGLAVNWGLPDGQLRIPVGVRPPMDVILEKVPALGRTTEYANVKELGTWAELDLSWAILGFSGCGTTSLAHNLGRHPDLQLLYVPDRSGVLESNFFWGEWPMEARFAEPAAAQVADARYLPYKKEVRLFNCWLSDQCASSEHQQRLRGIKSARYIHYDFALQRLARIAGLKVILIVQDPVKRIERGYFKNAYQWLIENYTTIPSMQDCLGKRCGPALYSMPGFSRPNNREFIVDPDSFLASNRIFVATSVYGQANVCLLDASELNRGVALYNRVVGFLGVGQFQDLIPKVKNTMHRASVSTLQMREHLLERGDASEAHESAVFGLRQYFAQERIALRELFKTLSPDRFDWGLPRWVAE